MANGQFSGTFQIGGITMIANSTRIGAGQEGHEPQLAAALSATLTTRSTTTTGVLTLPAGHGFVTGDKIAIFWLDPTTSAPRVMYGFTTTISGNSCTFTNTGGEFYGVSPAGTVLPTEGSTVTVSKKVSSNFAALASDVLMAGVNCDQPAVAIFAAASAIWSVFVATANGIVVWDAASGAATPLTSDPTKVVWYNCGQAAATGQYGVLLAT